MKDLSKEVAGASRARRCLCCCSAAVAAAAADAAAVAAAATAAVSFKHLPSQSYVGLLFGACLASTCTQQASFEERKAREKERGQLAVRSQWFKPGVGARGLRLWGQTRRGAPPRRL